MSRLALAWRCAESSQRTDLLFDAGIPLVCMASVVYAIALVVLQPYSWIWLMLLPTGFSAYALGVAFARALQRFIQDVSEADPNAWRAQVERQNHERQARRLVAVMPSPTAVVRRARL